MIPFPSNTGTSAGSSLGQALPRPATGTALTFNRLGYSTGAAPGGITFDFCFRPSLSGSQLTIGHGYVQSVGGDGPHAPEIDGTPIGGTTPAVLQLDPSVANSDGESFAVLQVYPNDQGQLTKDSTIEIVHSAVTTSNIATMGAKALTLILWSDNSPVQALPMVHFNLQYVRVLPPAGGGAPQHFFF